MPRVDCALHGLHHINKGRLIEHEEFAATDAPQVVEEIAKSPVGVVLVIVNAVVPVLERVTVWAVLVLLSA